MSWLICSLFLNFYKLSPCTDPQRLDFLVQLLGVSANGDLLIIEVSFDDSYVYRVNFERGVENMGRFSGEKMTLEDFLPRFEENAAIEVYSEYDGFRSYYVKGFYCLGEGVSEITLDFYFTGSVEYVVYE